MKKKINSFLNSQAWAKMWDYMWWIGYISILVAFMAVGFQKPTQTDCDYIKAKYIEYTSLQHNRHYKVLIDARDTVYFHGSLFLFDTVNFVYRRVVKISFIK